MMSGGIGFIWESIWNQRASKYVVTKVSGNEFQWLISMQR